MPPDLKEFLRDHWLEITTFLVGAVLAVVLFLIGIHSVRPERGGRCLGAGTYLAPLLNRPAAGAVQG